MLILAVSNFPMRKIWFFKLNLKCFIKRISQLKSSSSIFPENIFFRNSVFDYNVNNNEMLEIVWKYNLQKKQNDNNFKIFYFIFSNIKSRLVPKVILKYFFNNCLINAILCKLTKGLPNNKQSIIDCSNIKIDKQSI